MTFLRKFEFWKSLFQRKILLFFFLTLIIISLNVFFAGNFVQSNNFAVKNNFKKQKLINDVNEYFKKYSSYISFGLKMNFDFDFLLKVLKDKNNQDEFFFLKKIEDTFPSISFKNILYSDKFLEKFSSLNSELPKSSKIQEDKKIISDLIDYRKKIKTIKIAGGALNSFVDKNLIISEIDSYVSSNGSKSFFKFFHSSFFDKVFDFSKKFTIFWENFALTASKPSGDYIISQNNKIKKLFNLFVYTKEYLPSYKTSEEYIRESLSDFFIKNDINEGSKKLFKDEIDQFWNLLSSSNSITNIENDLEDVTAFIEIKKYSKQIEASFAYNFLSFLVDDFLKNFNKSLEKVNSLDLHGEYLYWKVKKGSEPSTKVIESLNGDFESENDALIELIKQNSTASLNDLKCYQGECTTNVERVNLIIDNYWNKIRNENKNNQNKSSLEKIFNDFFLFNNFKNKISNLISFFWFQEKIKNDDFVVTSFQDINDFFQNLRFDNKNFDYFFELLKTKIFSRLSDESDSLRENLQKQFENLNFNILNKVKDSKIVGQGFDLLNTILKGLLTFFRREINNIFRSFTENYQILSQYFSSNLSENNFTSIPKVYWENRVFFNEKIIALKKVIYKYENKDPFIFLNKNRNDIYENTQLRIDLLAKIFDFFYEFWNKIFKKLENYELKIVFFIVMQLIYKLNFINYDKGFYKFLENLNFFISSNKIELFLVKTRKFINSFKENFDEFIEDLEPDDNDDVVNFKNLFQKLGFEKATNQSTIIDESFFADLIDFLVVFDINYKPKNDEEKLLKEIFAGIFDKNKILDNFLIFISDYLEKNYYYYLQFSNWIFESSLNDNKEYKISFNDYPDIIKDQSKINFDIEFISSYQQNNQKLFSYRYVWNFSEESDGYRFFIKEIESVKI